MLSKMDMKVYEAIMNWNIPFIEHALQNGLDPNILIHEKEESALHYAVKNGCLEIVNLLLQYGANVNIKDYIQWTPLFWAARDNHVRIVELLLKNGAIVDTPTERSGERPLRLAVQNNRVYIAKLLLLAGADVNAICYQKSYLHVTAFYAYIEMTTLLLDFGICTTILHHGLTAIDIARSYGNNHISTLIEQYSTMEIKQPEE